MTVHTLTKSIYDRAKQMAKDGYGWENVRAELKVSEQVARIIVFGKYRLRKVKRRRTAA